MREAEKEEWFEAVRDRYQRGSKGEKGKLLNSLEETLGIHRKSLVRKLRKRNPGRKRKMNRGRRSKYDRPEFIKALRLAWRSTKYMNSRNLHAALPEWILSIERKYGVLSEQVRELLSTISPRTIDRVLKGYRAALKRKGGTKPGTLLKTEIPIQGSIWDVEVPGFLEADTVAHCGDSLSGQFVWSLTLTDINTQWTECRAVWHKAAKGVVEQVQDIERHLPFPMRGFDCDNGSEFLNNYLLAYFSEKRRRYDINFAFTRSRPYRKNDNAHVEQKNWTHPRQLYGRVRIDCFELVDMMNDLYINEFSLLRNHFYPNLKLQEKVRINSRYRRSYGKPKTPYQRVLEHPAVDTETKERLLTQHQSLDPLNLQDSVENKLKLIFLKLKTLKRSLLHYQVA
jgi:hypothetical protein